jgi:hypothetical protein
MKCASNRSFSGGRWLMWGALGASMMVVVLGCKKKKTAIDYAPDYSNTDTTTQGTGGSGGASGSNDTGGGHTTVGLTQVYVPKSGVVRIHYPAELVANPESDNLTFLEPMKSASVDVKSLVTITTNKDPISQDASEYARVLQGARAKALTGYRLISTTKGHCYKDQDGVETRWEFDEGGTKMQGRACAFVHHKHGYSFMYAFKPGNVGDEAKLHKIVDATELTD